MSASTFDLTMESVARLLGYRNEAATTHPEDCRCGVCHCGCGGLAPLSDRTYEPLGYVRGEPHRYIQHHARGGWRGGRYTDSAGYVKVYAPGHPRAIRNHVYEHILIAERALGRPLPAGAAVHHVNEKKDDNRPENLVICPDHSYHMLLHTRKKAFDATGDPDLLRCYLCKQFDHPDNLKHRVTGSSFHGACAVIDNRRRRALKLLPCSRCGLHGPHRTYVFEAAGGTSALCARCAEAETMEYAGEQRREGQEVSHG